MSHAIQAVVYARVSTDTEEQAGSIPTQLARCKSYCEAMGWEVVAELFDQGVSGTTLDRPSWKKVEELITSGKANMVIATSLDRLARTDEFMMWLREKLHPAGADFATLAERIDTTTAAGRLALGILVQIAQFQAEQTREKTSAALTYRAQQGLWVVRAPFGTKLGPVKGIPVKDPEKWPWVEQMFEMAASGVPHGEILAYMKEHGVRGPGGGELAASTLTATLGNPFYIGYILHKGERYKAQHECLIDPDIWERAQKRKVARMGRRPFRAPYLLRGKVVTDQLVITAPEKMCGQPVPMVPYFARGKQGGDYPFYLRTDKRKKYGGVQVEEVLSLAGQEPPGSIRADQLDEAVIGHLIELAKGDRRGLLMVQAEAATERVAEEQSQFKAQKIRELSQVRRRRTELGEQTVVNARTANTRLLIEWDEQLLALDRREQELIGEIEACDDVLGRLGQMQLETEATVDQFNLVEELWKAQDWPGLTKLVDLLVESVVVRAKGKQYDVRVRLQPLPVIQEVLETIPSIRLVELL